VVPHLQELDPSRPLSLQDEALHLGGGVTGEEGREGAVAEEYHHREGVQPMGRGQRVGSRDGVEDLQLHPVEPHRLSRTGGPPTHPLPHRLPQDPKVEFPSGGEPRIRHPPHRDPPEQGLGPTDVVQVGMGEEE